MYFLRLFTSACHTTPRDTTAQHVRQRTFNKTKTTVIEHGTVRGATSSSCVLPPPPPSPPPPPPAACMRRRGQPQQSRIAEQQRDVVLPAVVVLTSSSLSPSAYATSVGDPRNELTRGLSLLQATGEYSVSHTCGVSPLPNPCKRGTNKWTDTP